MAEQQEWIFYETMWRNQAEGRAMPMTWWMQQYFRRWVDDLDTGLFESKEAAFCSNALYRYWNMVGVKNAHQECLIGQAGEVEPVYDEYTVSFFFFDPHSRALHLPQFPDFSGPRPSLTQEWQDRYLPVLVTRYESPAGFTLEQRVLSTTVGIDQKSMVLIRLTVGPPPAGSGQVWLCMGVSPAGPSGFRRHDRARSFVDPRWLQFLRYRPDNLLLEINQHIGPVLDRAPDHFGIYGNGQAPDPDLYLRFNPYTELRQRGALNGYEVATDYYGGFCQGVLAWNVNLANSSDTFTLDIRLPVDDFQGRGDLDVLRQPPADMLEMNNRLYWQRLLDGNGLQASLPSVVAHLFDLFRVCRATLLILADDGAIHPGPTIYDSFWIRDSSIEGIACTTAGDFDVPTRQFGEHYTSARYFHMEQRWQGSVSLYGFFGGDHEINDCEWDSNGEALWAFGRFDRLRGSAVAFGARVFTPYVVTGARWIRDNRTPFGLLYSGWSAEHLGDKDKPHFWDNFWAIAGLWEAAQLSQRLGAPQTSELWSIYDQVRDSTAASIRWVLEEQRRRGIWETFIPTGPADVGRLDSTMVGTVAYFHPCRLYVGEKLGTDIDYAARQTLETIWSHFVHGGFRHDSAWRCYGPYLTLQLAHAFLYIGDVHRMDQCLFWAVANAGCARVHDPSGGDHMWQVVQGAWNEQHNYPVSTDFHEFPPGWWYMGDIPHGWAAAELILLVRDILFFETDEDHDAHIFLAPGIMPHWLQGGQSVSVRDAPTIFGGLFGYQLQHNEHTGIVTIDIRQPAPAHVRYIFPCRLGSSVRSAEVDGVPATIEGINVFAAAGARQIQVTYNP